MQTLSNSMSPAKVIPATVRIEAEASRFASNLPFSADGEFTGKLDSFSLEAVVEHKISKFLDQVGGMYPEDLHSLILGKVEKPLLAQILRRTGGNQVHASRILGINRKYPVL
ncbi:MAG: helix-turn-helix domain-containing protein [Pseudomonadota bacterium]